jgi:hypothetical protein
MGDPVNRAQWTRKVQRKKVSEIAKAQHRVAKGGREAERALEDLWREANRLGYDEGAAEASGVIDG